MSKYRQGLGGTHEDLLRLAVAKHSVIVESDVGSLHFYVYQTPPKTLKSACVSGAYLPFAQRLRVVCGNGMVALSLWQRVPPYHWHTQLSAVGEWEVRIVETVVSVSVP